MKKLLYLLLAGCLMSSLALADYDFTGAIQSTSMPTDAEIRASLKQFNFSKEQEDAVFKDTKRKLQQMYSTKNMAQTNADLNQYLNLLKSGELDDYIDPATKRELLQSLSNLPVATTSTATSSVTSVKSSENAQTTRAKKYGPNRQKR